eukprot:scaffold291119_cov29-Prasinocladus_malaysianus.AAC.2
MAFSPDLKEARDAREKDPEGDVEAEQPQAPSREETEIAEIRPSQTSAGEEVGLREIEAKLEAPGEETSQKELEDTSDLAEALAEQKEPMQEASSSLAEAAEPVKEAAEIETKNKEGNQLETEPEITAPSSATQASTSVSGDAGLGAGASTANQEESVGSEIVFGGDDLAAEAPLIDEVGTFATEYR